MKDRLIPFGPGAWAVIAAYLVALVAIGWRARRAQQESSLKDFYLAGRGFGFFVLVLTLYATQYSGNTLLGFSGRAYRIGWSWISCLHFMTAIVCFYLAFAPQLHRRARARGYITPSDFLADRFRSPLFASLASVIMIVALANYLLAQLIAMGRAFEGLSGESSEMVFVWGVVGLALVIVIYETLGGLRAVAWTDVIQGSILFLGFIVLVVLVFEEFGGLRVAADAIAARPEDRGRLAPPTGPALLEWLSYILVVGMGGALYPQAVQRLYAARSAKVLRRSLAVMAFLPLSTTLVVVLLGIVGLAHFPGLGAAESDGVLTMLCREVQEGSEIGYWLVVVLFAGILAAIMSTADSALLSISSMFVNDLYHRWWRRDASQKELTIVGKVSSWGLIAILVALAIALRDSTLVLILDRKFDLLVQLVPGFFLGVRSERLRSGPACAGLVVGVVVSVGLAIAGYGKLYGVHAGLYGLAANLAVAVIGSLRAADASPSPSR